MNGGGGGGGHIIHLQIIQRVSVTVFEKLCGALHRLNAYYF